MNGDDTTDIAEVKDLAVASYLFSTGLVKLAGKRRLVNGEVLFQFSPAKVATDLISAYWNLQAPPVQPKQLFSAQRDLKDMIFSG